MYNFNPRPPRGGRHALETIINGENYISIHAPREGGDVSWSGGITAVTIISIHAPREGGDWIGGEKRF